MPEFDGHPAERLTILQELRDQLRTAFQTQEQAHEPTRRSLRPWRGRVVAISGAAAALLLALVLASGAAKLAPLHATTPGHTVTPAKLATRRSATIRLAGYKFRLPAGYTKSNTACMPTPPPTPGAPVTVLGGFQAAGSAAGGCVQAALASSKNTTVANAQAVAVGPYSGYLQNVDEQLVLHVEIPTAQGNDWLLLTAEKLTAQQLVQIAASGLPSSIGSSTGCTNGCG